MPTVTSHLWNKNNPMEQVSLNLNSAIQSIEVVTGHPSSPQSGPAPPQNADPSITMGQIEQKKNQLTQLCSDLENLIKNLAQSQAELIVQHKQDIANLSVEIARKIIAHKVENDDYQIKQIVENALEDAPVNQDIIVRLNPKDCSQIEQLVKQSKFEIASQVTFVADAKIGPAECVLETPKGIIESFIDQHLEKIKQALVKAG